MLKKVSIAGAIAYLILAILAYVFFVERSAFLDIAFHLFYIIKDDYFAIQNNRFVAFITQLFPLTAIKIGLDLQTVMKFYSVGFVLYYGAIFAVITTVFKSWKYGLIMLLSSVLMVTHTFYWIQSELPQGLAMLVLYFALLDFYIRRQTEIKSNIWFYPLSLLMIFTLVFAHPLILFPFVFVSVYLYIRDTAGRQIYLGSLIAFMGMFTLKYFFFRTEYDSQAFNGLGNFVYLFPNYLNLTSNRQFLIHLISDYYLLFTGMLILGLGYFSAFRKDRSFIVPLLVFGFIFGYLFMINISYPHGGAQFYMENLYLPVSLMVLFPLVLEFSERFDFKYWLPILFVLLALRIGHIGLSHTLYSGRIEYLTGILEDAAAKGHKKLIIPSDQVDRDTLMMTWGSVYEFWLLSNLKFGETFSIVISDNPSELAWAMDHTRHFITNWGAFDYAVLNARYFMLRDTNRYQLR